MRSILKDSLAWVLISLAFAGIVYAGPMQDVGPGNPRPKAEEAQELVSLSQYKKDLQALSDNLDDAFKKEAETTIGLSRRIANLERIIRREKKDGLVR